MLTRKLFTAMLVLGVVLSVAVPAQAANYYWTSTTGGDWDTDALWDLGTEPTINDYAGIGSGEPDHVFNNAVCTVSLSGEIAKGIWIGHAATGTLYVTGGTLRSDYDFRIGRLQFDWGNGTGYVYQSGGDVSQTQTGASRLTGIGWGKGDKGYYNMSGGTLAVKGGSGLNVGINGYGEFNLSGTGAATIDRNLWIAGSQYIYTMSGYENIYGTAADSEGYVNHNSGTMTIKDHLYVGYGGVGGYNISGGSLSVDDNVYVGTIGTGTGKFEVEDITAMISWNGSATIGANGTLSFVASAAGVSDIALDYAAGTLTINATAQLAFDLSAMSTAADDILLIDNYGDDAISGVFANYGEGDTVHTFGDGSYYTLSYVYDAGTDMSAGNDMALVANPIPEPSTLALLTAGLVGLLAYAWRKRK